MQKLSQNYEVLVIEWIPKQMNKVADTLAKRATGEGTIGGKDLANSSCPPKEEPLGTLQKEESVRLISKLQQSTLLDFCKISAKEKEDGEASEPRNIIRVSNSIKNRVNDTQIEEKIEVEANNQVKAEEEMQIEVSKTKEDLTKKK